CIVLKAKIILEPVCDVAAVSPARIRFRAFAHCSPHFTQHTRARQSIGIPSFPEAETCSHPFGRSSKFNK
ncbi:MAG: hypothetical protein P4L81_02455, partial [Candidatus Pacebacteria bacterium]|nr:hypothetical protein [Candidatus Paceibacterota bacterium]